MGEKAVEIALQKKFPLVCSIVPLVDAGALAAIQSDWLRAGERCAQKAVKIVNGTEANTIPIEFPDRVSIAVNVATAQKLGLKLPYEWIELATNVVE